MTTLIEISDPHNPITYTGKLVASNKSNVQEWCILDTDEGEMLFINNTLQSSMNDEVNYHEMFVHSLMSGCRKPKNVLILGGSEGCMVREVLKWNVDSVTQVDWDETLISYFKGAGASWNSNSYDDPRVIVVICEALEWLNGCTQKFDCIFIDLFDPTETTCDFMNIIVHKCKGLLSDGGGLSVNAGAYSKLIMGPDNFDGMMKCDVPSFKEDWTFLMILPKLWSVYIHEKVLPTLKYYSKERLIKSLVSKKLTPPITPNFVEPGSHYGC